MLRLRIALPARGEPGAHCTAVHLLPFRPSAQECTAALGLSLHEAIPDPHHGRLCEGAPRVPIGAGGLGSSEDQPLCMMAGGVDAKEKMELEMNYRAHLEHMQQVSQRPALTYCKGAQGLHYTVGSTKALPCDFVRCRCPEMNRHLLALRHVCPSCVLHWNAMMTGNAARST